MTTLTIGVLSRNNENHLSQLLESIRQQTCKEFDLVILDNGSDDSTSEIIEAFELPELPVIKLFNSQDTSEANGMKILFEKSKGLFISVIHGDDLLKPNYVHDVIAIVNQELAFDAITFPIEHLFETHENKVIENTLVSRANLTEYSVLNRFLVCGLNPGIMPGAVFDRRAIISADILSPITGIRFNFDIVFWIRFSRRGLKLLRSNECNYIYRRHTNQSSSQGENSLNLAQARNFNYENASTRFEKFLVVSSTLKESTLLENSDIYLKTLKHSYLEMSRPKLYIGTIINLLLRQCAKFFNAILN